MLILINVFLGVAKGPFMALMCDVTEPRERSVAYGFLNFMGGLGSIWFILVSDTLAVTTDLLASLWHLR